MTEATSPDEGSQKITNHIQGFHPTQQGKKFVVIHTLEDENNSWPMVAKKIGKVMVSSWYDVPYVMLYCCYAPAMLLVC